MNIFLTILNDCGDNKENQKKDNGKENACPYHDIDSFFFGFMGI